MTRKQPLRSLLVLLALLLLIFLKVIPGEVSAAQGVPGSAEFGFGAVLYPDGPYVNEGLALAEELRLNWVSIPLSWAAVQTGPDAPLNLDRLNAVMQFAQERKIDVLINLTCAPGWALTAQGPDPVHAARLVIELWRRYPSIRAVELFPGANTTQGWGSTPDAQAYTQFLTTVDAEMRRAGVPVLLVAAGLRPMPAVPPEGSVDDLVFLQALYQAGAAEVMPVISIQYSDLTGGPLTPIDGQERRILRHYEEVRKIMSANQHQKGRIWVTRLSPPSGTITPGDSVYLERNAQSGWLSQAYLQIRSQLYIGVAFLPGLNPSRGTVWAEIDRQVVSLIDDSGAHPFGAALGQLIAQNQSGNGGVKPGQPKDGNFGKDRP